jgi:deazaflavin-dependent oxidoreductase (nitroreductase family)
VSDLTGQDAGVRYADANAVQRLFRNVASTPALARLFSRVLYRVDRPVIRLSGGRRSLTAALTGLPIVELTTTGARTGLPRTMPIVGVPDGDRLVLVASYYGSPKHPAWFHNLRAHPECTVRLRGAERAMRAYEAEGEERDRLWELDLTVYPTRARYAEWTEGRRIPVMVLEPAD